MNEANRVRYSRTRPGGCPGTPQIPFSWSYPGWPFFVDFIRDNEVSGTAGYRELQQKIQRVLLKEKTFIPILLRRFTSIYIDMQN